MKFSTPEEDFRRSGRCRPGRLGRHDGIRRQGPAGRRPFPRRRRQHHRLAPSDHRQRLHARRRRAGHLRLQPGRRDAQRRAVQRVRHRAHLDVLKPSIEMLDNGEGVANYYINVGGNIKKNFTVNVSEMKDSEQTALMGCSAPRASRSARPPSWACRWSRSSAWPTSKRASTP